LRPRYLTRLDFSRPVSLKTAARLKLQIRWVARTMFFVTRVTICIFETFRGALTCTLLGEDADFLDRSSWTRWIEYLRLSQLAFNLGASRRPSVDRRMRRVASNNRDPARRAA
jgi:hypothetical protein